MILDSRGSCREVPTLVDLFCGCGGLTLGAKRAGFETVLAIDNDPVLSGSFARNFPRVPFLLADISLLDATALKRLLPKGVDGVVGGPPCQAFSEIGRQLATDRRRDLIDVFFRVVSDVRPSFFLLENVRGLMFPSHRPALDAGLERLDGGWTIIGPLLLDASDFGAPTRRARMFVIGFNRDRVRAPSEQVFSAAKNVMRRTVRDAISDLSGARQLCDDDAGFDRWRYGPKAVPSPYAKRMRSASGTFSGHRRTTHTMRTLRRFAELAQGKVDRIGKYPRLEWDSQCPVLRAGTGFDHGKYQAVRPIHPSQDRVITVREAARLQGFPDNFIFHPTIWHSFRMIGNSVSPIIARAILKRILAEVAGPFQNSIAAE